MIDLLGQQRLPQLRAGFDRYQHRWMTWPLNSYSTAMVHEFYTSYRSIVVLPMHHYPGFIRFVWQPYLDHTLVRSVRVDVRKKTIHRVIFGQDYITPIPTAKCVHILKIAWDCHIMQDAEHRAERLEMARWIISYISPQGDEAPQIEGPVVIKKGLLTLECRFWWLLIRYCLLLITLDNALMWEGAALVS